MSRKNVIAIIVISVAILSGSIVFINRMIPQDALPAERVNLSNPEHRKILCGVTSLLASLERLGIYCNFADMVKQCKITVKGISLRELERAANAQMNVEAQVRILDWSDLRGLNSTAVLFVNGDHYIAADPRESELGADYNRIRIYEDGMPAKWITRKDLDDIWAGQTLIVSRTEPTRRNVDGPLIRWDTCLIDNGIMQPNSIDRYAFAFKNVGDDNLEIKTIKKSCGCTTFTLTNSIVAPGEYGKIEVENNLSGKEGYIENKLFVVTNSVMNPNAVLRMIAGVPRTRVLSAQKISLGDVPQGATVERELYAINPAFGPMNLRHVFFVRNGNEKHKDLIPSINYGVLEGNAQRIASQFRGKPEDYVIRFELMASEDCAVGPFQGQLVAVVEKDDDVTTHTTDIGGFVVPDVYSAPSTGLIVFDGGVFRPAVIELRSRQSRDLQITRAWSTDALINIKHVGNLSYELSVVSELNVVPGGSPMQSTAFFELHNGKVISLPIVIYAPPLM